MTHSSVGGGGMVSGTSKTTPLLTIGEVKERQLGANDKQDYFATRATTMHIKPDNLMYPACPSAECNKKVIEEADGWRCEKCDKTYPQPEYRRVIPLAFDQING